MVKNRRWIALLTAVALLACAAVTGSVGLAAGVMGSDGCSPVPTGPLAYWLVTVWPLALLTTAVVPPYLIARGAAFRAAVTAFGIGCLISILVWMLWIPILDLIC